MKYRLGSLVLTGIAFAGTAFAGPVTITAPEAEAGVRASSLTLIDVRRPDEWRSTGLPEGAVGISVQDPDFVAKVLAQLGDDRSRPVATICRTGRRSAAAAAKLEAAGFSTVSNVREGFVGRAGAGPGWRARGLPVMAFEAGPHPQEGKG